MLDLAELNNMPSIPGLSVPGEFYWVLQQPVPLAGMCYPSARTPWHNLYTLGFRHVICLEGYGPAYDPSPLMVSQRMSLEDLYGGRLPQRPAQEERLIHAAAQAVLAKWQADEGVIVHCAGGTGRTGTVLGCVLRAFGVST